MQIIIKVCVTEQQKNTKKKLTKKHTINRFKIEDFPTPESPISNTLNK